jgi:hypothetical protein
MLFKGIKMAKSTKPATRTTIINRIVASFANAKKAHDDLELMSIQEQDKLIQQLVDAHLVACTTTKALYMRGNSAKNDARKEVKELFEKLANDKYISQGTVKTYQGCFWIAFETGVPFSRNLANAKTEAKKVETAKTESATKAGKVETTTIAEMHKTLSKALAQARILNQTIFAGELVDFIIATYPDFKETVLAK